MGASPHLETLKGVEMNKSMTLDEMQEACKMIEVDGDECVRACANQFGWQVARLLLVAHLRRGFGSMEGYPPRLEIDNEVRAHLGNNGLSWTTVAEAKETMTEGRLEKLLASTDIPEETKNAVRITFDYPFRGKEFSTSPQVFNTLQKYGLAAIGLEP